MNLFTVTEKYGRNDAIGMLVSPVGDHFYKYVAGPNPYPHSQLLCFTVGHDIEPVPEELQNESWETIKLYLAL